MKITGIKDIVRKKDIEEKRREVYQNLSLAVSLAGGLVWKDKVPSFNRLIAEELLKFFEDDLSDIEYYSVKNKFYRIPIEDNALCFHKNNLFRSDSIIGKEEFLNQNLLYLEKKELPQTLTGKEKEEILKGRTEKESILLNQNYNRQELNGSRYFLELKEKEKEELLRLLEEKNYFSITVRNYLEKIRDNKEILTVPEGKAKDILNVAYDSYILEIGAFVAKQLKKELEK